MPLGALALWFAACAPPELPPAPRAVSFYDDLPQWEDDLRLAHDETPVALSGRVVDLDGVGLEGAVVELHGLAAVTDADGAFRLSGLPRRNALARVTAPGRQPERIFSALNVPVATDEVALAPIVAVPDGPVRFTFTGDTSLGRRYLDPEERASRYSLPPDDPDALIRVSDPLPGSRAVFAHVRDGLTDAEVLVTNLETVVTDRPATPHPTKDYVIFTLTDSLTALTDLGVDWISLGNNHVYDYLEPGVVDTLAALQTTGVPHGGLGADADAAFAPSGLQAGGVSWRILAANSVSGRQHDVDYQADDHSGGAADLEDEPRVAAALADAWAAGEVPIAFLHTGMEYTEAPTAITAERFDRVAADGAAFIVATHPHTAQGFGWHGDTLAAWSLGNFAFDQDRLETYQAVVLHADLLPDGRPAAARAQPLYVEDYVPRWLGGELAALLALRMARDSTAWVVPDHGAWVILDGVPVDHPRTLDVAVTLAADGAGWLDLRALVGEAEWLSAVDADGLAVDIGHDRLGFGAFEDLDVDDEWLEDSRWYLGGPSKLVCLGGAVRGVAGLCSHRSSEQHEDGLWNFRERIRVAGDAEATPNKDQWLVAAVRNDGGGDLDVELTFQASEGDRDFGAVEVALAEAGVFDWRRVAVPIPMPPDTADPEDPTANARAVRLSFRHRPPSHGEGWVFLDDVAVVAWEPLPADLGIGPTRFLRVRGAPGVARLTLTLTTRAAW